MNVTLPNKSKIDIKTIIMYILIIIFCLVSIGLAVYNQFLDGKIVTTTVGTLAGKSEEDYDTLKAEFDDIFTNKLEGSYNKNNLKLENKEKEIVYTLIEGNKCDTNNYDMEIHIPYINIDNETIKKYNNDINTYVEKVKSIAQTKNQNTVYTVEYGADIEDDILSVVIKSNLKEGASAQRVIIQTYNYNLKTNKEVTFKDILAQKEVAEDYVQSKINDEIAIEQKNAEDLISLGYNIYARNVKDDIYQLKNIKEFYTYNGSIYIIFAYGNDARTSELDVVIL